MGGTHCTLHSGHITAESLPSQHCHQSLPSQLLPQLMLVLLFYCPCCLVLQLLLPLSYQQLFYCPGPPLAVSQWLLQSAPFHLTNFSRWSGGRTGRYQDMSSGQSRVWSEVCTLGSSSLRQISSSFRFLDFTGIPLPVQCYLYATVSYKKSLNCLSSF